MGGAFFKLANMGADFWARDMSGQKLRRRLNFKATKSGREISPKWALKGSESVGNSFKKCEFHCPLKPKAAGYVAAGALNMGELRFNAQIWRKA